ncbi:MAG: alpha/beta hydrolase [Candidatus Rokuibacteriota bacterium]
MIAERAATLATGDGVVLEARLAHLLAPVGGVAVAHPHPLYGGDMDNPVVVRVAEVCADLGFATLRFNFRGVGASTGTHGGGDAEERDVEAALTHLREILGVSRPLALAGYSFGATIAARVATRRGAGSDLAGLALIAPPVAMVGDAPFLALAGLAAPLLVVAGSQDQYCPAEALAELTRRLPRATVSIIEGANHFFFGKLFLLGEAVAGWARGLVTRESGGRRSTG